VSHLEAALPKESGISGFLRTAGQVAAGERDLTPKAMEGYITRISEWLSSYGADTGTDVSHSLQELSDQAFALDVHYPSEDSAGTRRETLVGQVSALVESIISAENKGTEGLGLDEDVKRTLTPLVGTKTVLQDYAHSTGTPLDDANKLLRGQHRLEESLSAKTSQHYDRIADALAMEGALLLLSALATDPATGERDADLAGLRKDLQDLYKTASKNHALELEARHTSRPAHASSRETEHIHRHRILSNAEKAQGRELAYQIEDLEAQLPSLPDGPEKTAMEDRVAHLERQLQHVEDNTDIGGLLNSAIDAYSDGAHEPDRIALDKAGNHHLLENINPADIKEFLKDTKSEHGFTPEMVQELFKDDPIIHAIPGRKEHRKDVKGDIATTSIKEKDPDSFVRILEHALGGKTKSLSDSEAIAQHKRTALPGVEDSSVLVKHQENQGDLSYVSVPAGDQDGFSSRNQNGEPGAGEQSLVFGPGGSMGTNTLDGSSVEGSIGSSIDALRVMSQRDPHALSDYLNGLVSGENPKKLAASLHDSMRSLAGELTSRHKGLEALDPGGRNRSEYRLDRANAKYKERSGGEDGGAVDVLTKSAPTTGGALSPSDLSNVRKVDERKIRNNLFHPTSEAKTVLATLRTLGGGHIRAQDVKAYVQEQLKRSSARYDLNKVLTNGRTRAQQQADDDRKTVLPELARAKKVLAGMEEALDSMLDAYDNVGKDIDRILEEMEKSPSAQEMVRTREVLDEAMPEPKRKSFYKRLQNAGFRTYKDLATHLSYDPKNNRHLESPEHLRGHLEALLGLVPSDGSESPDDGVVSLEGYHALDENELASLLASRITAEARKQTGVLDRGRPKSAPARKTENQPVNAPLGVHGIDSVVAHAKDKAGRLLSGLGGMLKAAAAPVFEGKIAQAIQGLVGSPEFLEKVKANVSDVKEHRHGVTEEGIQRALKAIDTDEQELMHLRSNPPARQKDKVPLAHEFMDTKHYSYERPVETLADEQDNLKMLHTALTNDLRYVQSTDHPLGRARNRRLTKGDRKALLDSKAANIQDKMSSKLEHTRKSLANLESYDQKDADTVSTLGKEEEKLRAVIKAIDEHLQSFEKDPSYYLNGNTKVRASRINELLSQYQDDVTSDENRMRAQISAQQKRVQDLERQLKILNEVSDKGVSAEHGAIMSRAVVRSIWQEVLDVWRRHRPKFNIIHDVDDMDYKDVANVVRDTLGLVDDKALISILFQLKQTRTQLRKILEKYPHLKVRKEGNAVSFGTTDGYDLKRVLDNINQREVEIWTRLNTLGYVDDVVEVGAAIKELAKSKDADFDTPPENELQDASQEKKLLTQSIESLIKEVEEKAATVDKNGSTVPLSALAKSIVGILKEHGIAPSFSRPAERKP
jgi:predicted transcriptional regulator YheO